MSPLILAALMHAASAQTYPNVVDLTPFTQPANYMSLRGILRLRYVQSGGPRTWNMTRAQIDAAAASQAATGYEVTPFTQPANYMSLYGSTRLRYLQRGVWRFPTREQFNRLPPGAVPPPTGQ